MTSFSLREEEPPTPAPRHTSRVLIVLIVLLILVLAGVGFVGYRVEQRTTAMEQQVAALSRKSDETAAQARKAMEYAESSESAARTAADLRHAAEAETAGARQEAAGAKQEADAARQDATSAREAEAQAKAEAAAIRKKAEAEVNRLEAALGQVAETRRTALGVIMNLGEDHLKFEFDKADLRQQDRELLSRIAGIILTSHDYTISVNGHTDDVGSDAYNKALSERRAQAVRDYLVKAGLPPEIMSIEAHGKSLPRVPGTSDAARAKNRRVELAIMNTQIRYGK